MRDYWNFYGPLKTLILLKLCRLKINFKTLRRVDRGNTIVISQITIKSHYISLAPVLSASYYVISPNSNSKEQLLNSECTRIYSNHYIYPRLNKFIVNRSGELLEPFKSYINTEEDVHIHINVEIRYHGNYYIVDIRKPKIKEQYIIRHSDGKLLDLGEGYIFEIIPGGDEGGNICRVTKIIGGQKYCNYFDTKTEKYLLPSDILVNPLTYLGHFSENKATWFDTVGKSHTLLDPHYL